MLSLAQGFISSEEFLSIPELSINPLAQRLSFFVESINFKEFVTFLSGFSAKAGREEKLKVMFDVYDVDGKRPRVGWEGSMEEGGGSDSWAV